MQTGVLDDRRTNVSFGRTLKVSDPAARVFAAVAASPNRVFRFGTGRLAFVTHLTNAQVGRAVRELHERRFITVFHADSGKRTVLKITTNGLVPDIDLGRGALMEIHHCAQVDFDCLPAVSKHYHTPLQLDGSRGMPASEKFLQHRSVVVEVPTGDVRELVESSLAHYLSYLLYGPGILNPSGRERTRASTNWMVTTEPNCRYVNVTDGTSCTDVSLAGYWAWRVGVQTTQYGQPLSFPDIVGIARMMSRFLNSNGAQATIKMLDYAALNWRKLVYLPQLQSACLPRLASHHCWVNENFVHAVRCRVARSRKEESQN